MTSFRVAAKSWGSGWDRTGLAVLPGTLATDWWPLTSRTSSHVEGSVCSGHLDDLSNVSDNFPFAHNPENHALCLVRFLREAAGCSEHPGGMNE